MRCGSTSRSRRRSLSSSWAIRPGARHGGVIQQITREIQVEALPMAVPEHIEVDIERLEIGDTLRLEDVPAIEDVAYLDDPDETVIANCTIPRAFALLEEEEAEAAEAAEAEEAEGEAAEGEEAAEAAAEAGEQPAAGETGETSEA